MKYVRTKRTFIVEGILTLTVFIGGVALCATATLPWLGGTMIFAVIAHSLTYGEGPWGA